MARLFLDFDGVLCDSNMECLSVAWRALVQVDGLATPQLPAGVARYFLDHRGEVVAAKGYYPLLRLALAGQPYRHEAYLQAASDLAEEMKAFHEAFYAIRRQAQQQDPRAWLESNPPTPFARKLFGRVRKPRPEIVSFKDKTTIDHWLGHYFPEAGPMAVAGTETMATKKAFFAAAHPLAQAGKVPALFVDDHPENVAEALSCGIPSVLADWGYATPRQRAQATVHGIEICGAEEVLARIERLGKE